MQLHATVFDAQPAISGFGDSVQAGQTVSITASCNCPDPDDGEYAAAPPDVEVSGPGGDQGWVYFDFFTATDVYLEASPPPDTQPGTYYATVDFCDGFLPFDPVTQCEVDAGPINVEEPQQPACTLTVASPVNNQVYGFSGPPGNYNQASVPLNAQSNCSGTAGWGLSWSYTEIHNPNGVYLGSVTNTTQTLNQTVTYTTPAGNGGLLGMVVSTAFGAQQSVLPYVDGTPIQPSVIVSQLGAMYNGTTPNLLVGIAFRESSCSQFLFTTNPYINQTYGIAGYWPNENANGTYIGLMMVPPTLSTLFDWTSNAAQGLSVLQYFLAAAARHYSQEIASYPSLPQLTALQQEQDALWLYGGWGSYGDYYVPNSSYNGWVVTTANNTGVNYVQNVYSSASADNCMQ